MNNDCSVGFFENNMLHMSLGDIHIVEKYV